MSHSKSVRLLPGVIIVAIQWILWYFVPALIPEALVFGIFIVFLSVIALLLWWFLFSRIPILEKIGAILCIGVSLFITSFFIDKSIATANMGLLFGIYSLPISSFTLVLGTYLGFRVTDTTALRRITMTSTIILGSAIWLLVRTDGMDGDGNHDFTWRWAKTHEDVILSDSVEKKLKSRHIDIDESAEAQWPGFRGRDRNSIVHGVKIQTDWTTYPPVELWHRQIGPGCSSFGIQDSFLFTQEQLGEYEIVSCYHINTGKTIWRHRDKARFYDSHAGAGPRSTPTLAKGRVFTLGATGILNVLSASNGSLIWSRNAAKDAKVKVLQWGFTSSPVVVNSTVIIALSGKLAAYNIDTGKSLWFGSDGGNSYSSPQTLKIENTLQIVLMSKSGALSVDPFSGKQYWQYSWEGDDRILQPAYINQTDLLLTTEMKTLRRISIARKSDQWTIKEIWTSKEMKPNHNDFVIHKGYAYGFEGPRLSCINLDDGKRMWKGDRLRGFLIVLADQDLILILSEKGELFLVSADPKAFILHSRIQGIKGKTWNHPALMGTTLVVRNAQEMAAFRLN